MMPHLLSCTTITWHAWRFRTIPDPSELPELHTAPHSHFHPLHTRSNPLFLPPHLQERFKSQYGAKRAKSAIAFAMNQVRREENLALRLCVYVHTLYSVSCSVVGYHVVLRIHVCVKCSFLTNHGY